MMADTITNLIRARLTAVRRLKSGEVTDEDFHLARHIHLLSFAEYALQQQNYAAWAPPTDPQMYEQATAESALNGSCGNLLTTLGLMILNPDRAAHDATQPAPRIVFQ